MIDILLLLALIFIFALLILVVAVGLRIGVIPEDERRAVYRLGRFHRFLDPGVAWWMERIDGKIDHIDIRMQPRPISMQGLVLNGIPVSLTLSIWSAFDPALAIGWGYSDAERERLITLLKLNPETRDDQMRAEIRDLTREELKRINQLYPAPADAPELARLKPVLSGTEENDALLRRLETVLPDTMRAYGFLVDPDRRITLTRTVLPQELLEALGRGRRVEQLRQQFPNLSDEALAQLLASIEGRPQMNLQKIVVESGGEVLPRIESSPDGRGETMVVLDPSRSRPQNVLPAQAKAEIGPESSSPISADDEDSLNEQDLNVLKEIPVDSGRSERRTG